MKKMLCFLLAAVMSLSLVSCLGNVKDVRVDIEPSEIYSEEEIDDAVYEVLHYFKREFGGCTLTGLSYIESKNTEATDEWAAQYDADRAIVLTSTFEVTGKTDGSLAYGETYQNWSWILVQDSREGWQVKTSGY